MAVDGDWVFMRAAVPDLREYILSNDVYWTLRQGPSPAGGQVSRLSVGNLLLSQARLSAAALAPEENQELAGLLRQANEVREEWRANWSQKAAREFSARLNLWQQYLRELRGDGRSQSAYYAREVRNRAILRLLWSEVLPGGQGGIPPADKEQLEMLDNILRGLTREGPFVWEPELQAAFPREGFWFLYVEPERKG